MSLFVSSKLGNAAQTSSPSPTWSVYEELWGDDTTGAGEVPSIAAAPRLPYISYPPPTATLKGSHLTKKAPIRRGAQGAVYAAYDTSARTPQPAHVDATSAELTSGSQGTPVAVKRIFAQSNDFGARDVAATVLREVTLHRFVCAQQDRALSREVMPGASQSCALDDSACMLRLHRTVEAPHKELCLVLELAATSLERLLAPPTGHGVGGGGGAGGFRKKPGTVALFGGLGGGGGLGREDPAALVARAVPAGARCPLLSAPPLVRYLMRRLLRLVCFLHDDCGVVHRDLKPSNVLVTEGGGLRLGDFGSARFLPPSTMSAARQDDKGQAGLTPSYGTATAAAAAAHSSAAPHATSTLECTPPSMRTTLHYRPPEVLYGDQLCRPAGDVWALGVMFAQLLLQKNLFHAESELDLLGAIQKLLGTPTTTPPWLVSTSLATSTAPFTVGSTGIQASLPHKLHSGIVSAEGLDLVTRMLHQQPDQRLTVREAMQHPFLNPADTAADDDAAGAALWQSKVAQAEQQRQTSEQVSRGRGGILGGRGVMGSLMLGLDDASGADEEDEEEEGLAPFRLNLGGGFAALT